MQPQLALPTYASLVKSQSRSLLHLKEAFPSRTSEKKMYIEKNTRVAQSMHAICHMGTWAPRANCWEGCVSIGQDTLGLFLYHTACQCRRRT